MLKKKSTKNTENLLIPMNKKSSGRNALILSNSDTHQ